MDWLFLALLILGTSFVAGKIFSAKGADNRTVLSRGFVILIIISVLSVVGYFVYGETIKAFPNIDESKIKRDFLEKRIIDGRGREHEFVLFLKTIESVKSVKIIKKEKLKDLLDVTVQAELSDMETTPAKAYKGEFLFKYQFRGTEWDFQDIIVNICSESK